MSSWSHPKGDQLPGGEPGGRLRVGLPLPPSLLAPASPSTLAPLSPLPTEGSSREESSEVSQVLGAHGLGVMCRPWWCLWETPRHPGRGPRPGRAVGRGGGGAGL